MEIKERTCPICGKHFLPYNQNQVYCSPECSTLGGDRSERENRRYQAALAKALAKRAKLETKPQLSISDAARLLNVSRPTIYRLIDEGTFSPIRIRARSVRIPREQLQNLIPESKADSVNPPDKVISKDEALTRYGISETWLYRKTRALGIRSAIVGGKADFPKKDLDRRRVAVSPQAQGLNQSPSAAARLRRAFCILFKRNPISLHRFQRQCIMIDSNYWIENFVSYSSPRSGSVHQANKEFEIEVSDSVDFNPMIDVYIAKNEKLSIQVPKSSKYQKVKRIQEEDFLHYFNQTLYRFDHLETTGGEYYIDTEDYAEYYKLEAFIEKPHINITLCIHHGADMCDCRMSVSHTFGYRPGIRRNFVPLSESTFRQVFNLMLEFCHERDAYKQFQDTLFAQVQALICNDKPIGGLIIDANKYFDKAKAEMLERRKNIELRLVSVDESPQKRRELRAEMKGIDFCISVLDANR